MGKRDDTTTALLVLGSLTTVGLASLAFLLNGGGSAPQPNTPRERRPIDWFGGNGRDNVLALAFLFASENAGGSLLLWALQGIAANNWARLLARGHPQIRSIADMLRCGIVKKDKRWYYQLGWGPQFDKGTHVTRWAATSAGRVPMAVSWHFTEFAERLLNNRIDLEQLVGRRGETLPDLERLRRIHSFLQYEGFGEIVVRQAGKDAERNPDVVVRNWGDPHLMASVEGVRFYG